MSETSAPWSAAMTAASVIAASLLAFGLVLCRWIIKRGKQ